MIDTGNSDISVQRARCQILSEIPGDSPHSSLSFVKNTLKAFCNFYRFSIGDLSVAVVAPVKALLSKLEEIEQPR